jgi:hypothetical protein
LGDTESPVGQNDVHVAPVAWEDAAAEQTVTPMLLAPPEETEEAAALEHWMEHVYVSSLLVLSVSAVDVMAVAVLAKSLQDISVEVVNRRERDTAERGSSGETGQVTTVPPAFTEHSAGEPDAL